MTRKIFLVLLAIIIALPIGCTGYNIKVKKNSIDKDDYVLVCKYRGPIEDCSYVDRVILERQLDTIRNRSRY